MQSRKKTTPTESSTLPVPSATPVPATVDDLPEADLDSEDIPWLNVTEIDELAQCVNTCVERWRNAGPEARKKMFALFAVAGIFLAVCRHGHVLAICDMIRSGELYVSPNHLYRSHVILLFFFRMKYPLAIVERLALCGRRESDVHYDRQQSAVAGIGSI